MSSKIIYHRNGFVTYFATYGQSWEKQTIMPDHELATLCERDRNRVIRHQGKKKRADIEAAAAQIGASKRQRTGKIIGYDIYGARYDGDCNAAERASFVSAAFAAAAATTDATIAGQRIRLAARDARNARRRAARATIKGAQ